MKTSRSFAAEAGSVHAARRFVWGTARDVDKERHDAIAVMAAELAMNAVQHARTGPYGSRPRFKTGAASPAR